MKPSDLEVVYTVTYEQDDAPVRGNAVASGDGAQDTEIEDKILASLDRGDVYAWAVVTVTASVRFEGRTFKGSAHLAGCSYASPDALEADCLEQLKPDALEALAADVQRGEDAASVLAYLEGPEGK